MKGLFKGLSWESRIFPFIRALAAAYGLTAIAFVALAVALTYTDMSEGYIPLVSAITTAGSCFVGGIISGRGIKSMGLFMGVVSAVLYILIMLVIGLFTESPVSLGIGSVSVIIMAMGSGAVGGILGVNV